MPSFIAINFDFRSMIRCYESSTPASQDRHACSGTSSNGRGSSVLLIQYKGFVLLLEVRRFRARRDRIELAARRCGGSRVFDENSYGVEAIRSTGRKATTSIIIIR